MFFSCVTCFDKTFANLRIPLLWKKNAALKFCSKLGNGKIYMPSHLQNLSVLNAKAVYGQYHSTCKEWFWTPFSDERVEGVFVNEYTGEILKYFTWILFHNITFLISEIWILMIPVVEFCKIMLL